MSDPSKGHVRIDHEFAHDYLSYDAGVTLQPCVKASCYFRRKPGVSFDHFTKHWASVHADLTVAAPPFAQYNVLRYVQHHTSPAAKARLAKMGQQVLDFDGCSTLWFRNWDDYEQFFTAPDFSELVADGDLFMDTSSVTVYAGHDMIAFGKGHPGIDTSDGIAQPNTAEG
ncbi:hypothetical protein SPBR_05349 [Sporothrix brasiliensis 5110]|uniref:EthD domain-containing protein n=1 Tax=Sporothrix brasiliensis 5110 TaxID=1398154 RepID=A0A0C2IK57_9PEZI|nr:uncharacterized protein SPBR_05349 [Sporothrix brasiliensis 5110]KIH87360.1 hypothetical protein SPBR_05349 [Sporothrix brasiliensis 5110]